LKNILRFPLLLIILLFASVRFAHAQEVSAYFGLGTATDSSNGQSINTFGDGVFHPTPRMTGLFTTFGGDFMLNRGLGFGVEYAFRNSQGDYAGLNYRPNFYDFNAIWHPVPISKRVVPELQAGLGGVKLNFYYNQQFCNAFAGCNSSNSLLASSNHFQVHVAGGIRFYVTPNVYVRPQIDVHLVHNFFQFGSDVVPRYSVAIGYTFGH
jgi:hypothetical protein